MRELSLLEMIGTMSRWTLELDHVCEHAIEQGSKILLEETKSIPGNYQHDWPALKPATIARKAHGDTPLLETGEMRDSYERTIVSHTEAVIGSNNDKAVWHELGTSRVPPRPVLMNAATNKERELRELLGKKAIGALSGRGSD